MSERDTPAMTHDADGYPTLETWIDAAWEVVEETLPEYWRIRSLTEVPKAGWEVVATDGNRIRIANGKTPGEALSKLAGASA